jgi:hypothetical protein
LVISLISLPISILIEWSIGVQLSGILMAMLPWLWIFWVYCNKCNKKCGEGREKLFCTSQTRSEGCDLEWKYVHFFKVIQGCLTSAWSRFIALQRRRYDNALLWNSSLCNAYPFCVGFDFLMAVNMKVTVFWHVTPCSVAGIFRRFGVTCWIYIKDRRISWAWTISFIVIHTPIVQGSVPRPLSLYILSLFCVKRIFIPWRWRQHVTPKRRCIYQTTWRHHRTQYSSYTYILKTAVMLASVRSFIASNGNYWYGLHIHL